jgi:hypothetical protein
MRHVPRDYEQTWKVFLLEKRGQVQAVLATAVSGIASLGAAGDLLAAALVAAHTA